MQKPHERFRRKIEKENLWLFVLSVLKKHSNLSGAEIKQKLIDSYDLRIGSVTSYKVLYLLGRGGYVGNMKEAHKKLYFLTSKGRKELEEGKNLLKQYLLLLEKHESGKNSSKKREKRHK
jgi:DNA-binding PadR family transcriptional regulator